MFTHDLNIVGFSVTVGLGLGGIAWRNARDAALASSPFMAEPVHKPA